MSKVAKNYEQLAAALGFRLDAVRDVIYGHRAEFEFMIYAPNPSYPYMLSITTSAKFPAGQLYKDDIKQYVKSEKAIASLVQNGNLLQLAIANTPNQNKLRDKLNIGINSLIGFMKSRGFVPCCQFCGQQAETAGYVSGSSYMHLCPECAGKLRRDVTVATQKTKEKKENIVGGIVGAMIGAVIGVLCILFFSQVLQIIASVSGIIMALCTIKGYELMGGKLTKKGAVISVIMMLIMTYAANRMNWAIIVARYFSIDIFDAFNSISLYIAVGRIEFDTYILELVKLYIFTAIGAAPTIMGAMQQYKEEGQFSQIGM
ncbi:MAG: hypothetical protein NC433_11465 [Clostridiales bacterium]|nr:hypothetical protein [Clostridiales bacterium]